MDVQIYPYRMSYAIAWFVGAVALLLTIAGVYGVLSYLVAQRTREMGVRMALGASGNSLIGLILGNATRLAVIGTAVGSIAALGVSKLFAHSHDVDRRLRPDRLRHRRRRRVGGDDCGGVRAGPSRGNGQPGRRPAS